MSAAQQSVFGRMRWIFAAALASSASLSGAVSLVVYDDVLRNGFMDYSYTHAAGAISLTATAHIHTGSDAIGFSSAGFDAVKFAAPSVLDPATYGTLDFWMYATAAQCNALSIIIEKNAGANDNQVATADIGNYVNCATSANQWTEVIVNLGASPMNLAVPFDRISLFDNTDGTGFNTAYFDDVTLQSAVVDPIFANGFEGGTTPPPVNGLVEDLVTYDNFTSDRFTWYDSAGKQRVAVLAHNDAQTFASSHGGELREFIYQTSGGPLTVRAPARGDGGFGYIVSHPGSEAHCVGGDSSSLGHQFAGSWSRVFQGRHHAIFRFTQAYPRYCGTSTAAEHDIPVTIDWFFSTGLDDPVWSVTYDMTTIGANVLKDDSRSPYGTMNIDGSTGQYMDHDVAGIRWGDRYQFITQPPAGQLARLDNPWNWQTVNTIPFVELWASNDGGMGLVQTQTMTQQDAGGGRVPPSDGAYDVSVYWNKTSAQGNACPDGSVDQQTGQAHSLPCIGYWPYQANSFSYGVTNDSVNDAKMTWGTQYGFLGQTAYQLRDSSPQSPGSTAPGYPIKSYAVYVVFGEHSAEPVDAEIARATALTSMSITATSGQVVTLGLGGPGRSDNVTYSPAGYNPVYGAIAVMATGNDFAGSISVSSPLKHPLIVIGSYAAGTYPTVKLGGVTLTPDVDYFASLRSSPNELWITLNKTLTGTTSLQITH